MADTFGEHTDDEIAQRAIACIFEANLVLRNASLRRIPVDVDLVDKPLDGHPSSVPQIIARVGDRGTP